MDELLATFKQHVIERSQDPGFIHHSWFIKYHLEIVEKIAREALEHYPQADQELVLVLVRLHDYGKILNFDQQYQTTLEAGKTTLMEYWFPETFVAQAISYAEILDKKLEIDLHEAPLEVQIVSSADGASHFVGPFFHLRRYDHPEKPFEELMQDNMKKLLKDRNKKIVLPEIRQAFTWRYMQLLEQFGELPASFLPS